MMRLFVCALAAASLTGCGNKSNDTPAPPAPPPADKPGTVVQMARVCDGRGFADSPAYVKGATERDVSPTAVLVRYTDAPNPEHRAVESDRLRTVRPVNAWDAQLVVCADMKSTGAGGTCDGRAAHDAAGTLTIREVKTAKVLATRPFTLRNGPTCMTEWNDKKWSPDRAMPSFTRVAEAELAPLQPTTWKPFNADSIALACQGAPIPAAAPYEKGKPTRIFLTYVDADGRGAPAPQPLPYTSGDPKFIPEIALVACIRARPDKLIKTCDFNNGNQLERYDGSFDVDIVEARTAHVLESKSFKAPRPSPTCPTIHAFYRKLEKTIDAADKPLEKYIRSFGDPSPSDL